MDGGVWGAPAPPQMQPHPGWESSAGVSASGAPPSQVVLDWARELLELGSHPDKARINLLTMLAADNAAEAPHIVHQLLSHVESALPQNKLPLIYVIDSILHNVTEAHAARAYREALGKGIAEVFGKAHATVEVASRRRFTQLLENWRRIGAFDQTTLQHLEATLQNPSTFASAPLSHPPSLQLVSEPPQLPAATMGSGMDLGDASNLGAVQQSADNLPPALSVAPTDKSCAMQRLGRHRTASMAAERLYHGNPHNFSMEWYAAERARAEERKTRGRRQSEGQGGSAQGVTKTRGWLTSSRVWCSRDLQESEAAPQQSHSVFESVEAKRRVGDLAGADGAVGDSSAPPIIAAAADVQICFVCGERLEKEYRAGQWVFRDAVQIKGGALAHKSCVTVMPT